jgi:hypothetical protein
MPVAPPEILENFSDSVGPSAPSIGKPGLIHRSVPLAASTCSGLPVQRLQATEGVRCRAGAKIITIFLENKNFSGRLSFSRPQNGTCRA